MSQRVVEQVAVNIARNYLQSVPEQETISCRRAPASRGQRDAGAVNPIRPGAVGQIGGSLRQGWSTWDRRSRPAGPIAGNGDHPGVARSVW